MQSQYEQAKSLTAEAELADIAYDVTQDNLIGVPLPIISEALGKTISLDELPLLSQFGEVTAYVHFSSERSDKAAEIIVNPAITIAVGVEADDYNGDDSGLFGHSELIFEIAAPAPWDSPETEPNVSMYISTAADVDEKELALIDKLGGGEGQVFVQAKDSKRELEFELPDLLAMIIRPRVEGEEPSDYLAAILDTLYDIQRAQLDQAAATKTI